MKPYYERDGITIYNSDCLEAMPQLDLVFDAIICDLPYGTTACSWDTIIPFEPLWENYKRLVKAKGAVVLFGSQPFTSKLVMSNLEWFKYEWIWKKTKAQGFMLAKLKPMRIHENILVFSQGKTNNDPKQTADNMIYHPQNLKPYNKTVNGVKEKNGQGHYRKSQKKVLLQEYTNYPISELYFHSERHPIHPTQKPVALLAYLIRTYTNPGEIILDNTAGSFTTAVACIKEGRRFVGIEKEEEYCRIGKERIIEALLASGNVQASCDTIDTQKLGYQLGLPLQDYQIPGKV